MMSSRAVKNDASGSWRLLGTRAKGLGGNSVLVSCGGKRMLSSWCKAYSVIGTTGLNSGQDILR